MISPLKIIAARILGVMVEHFLHSSVNITKAILAGSP